MKKTRADTITEELKIIAAGEIKPPAHIKLREIDWPFWDGIISARAKTTWTEPDIVHAANLARCFADMEELSRGIAEEGVFVTSPSTGAEVQNPRFALLNTLKKSSVTYAKLLHIHACATVGRSRDTGQRTKKEKELLASQPDDDLLAKPVIQ